MMKSEIKSLFTFDSSFSRELPELVRPWQPVAVPSPRLLALNEPLALELGADPARLRSEEGVALLSGNRIPAGAHPVALAYAGHQFGVFVPSLGDGRALLLGEVVTDAGQRLDLHLKGSGPTPFARNGDGKAAVGPMLREYVIGEAMHALGIPTTRTLSVVATGESIRRQSIHPGAVLCRSAASHIRIGTFEYAAQHPGPEAVQRLADYSIARHYPAAAESDQPVLALFESIMEAQASLIAKWMRIGFIHGVMNTDNMAVSGETIDYGPCAFMDRYDPATVFSSIDHHGRYAWQNQPRIACWNLARFAETLLPLLHTNRDAAVALANERLQTLPQRINQYWIDGMREKLGLLNKNDGDASLIEDLLAMMHAQQVDFTRLFRALSPVRRGDPASARSLFADPAAFDAWIPRWTARWEEENRDAADTAAAMDRVNPLTIPRNHTVEEALTAAEADDLNPFKRLLDAVTHPFDSRPGDTYCTEPAPLNAPPYRTFCGT